MNHTINLQAKSHRVTGFELCKAISTECSCSKWIFGCFWPLSLSPLSGFAVWVYPPQTTTVCSRGGEVAAAVRTTLCVILKLTRSSSFLLSLYSHGALTQDNNRRVFASPALFGMWISPPFRSFRWPFFVLMLPLIITSLLAEWQPSHLQRRVSPTRSDISSLS